MPPMALPARLDRLFPGITSARIDARAGAPPGVPLCFIAVAKTLGEEHHPPFYWLGRALDTIDDAVDRDAFHRRIRATHADEACGGEDDHELERVLSEACAFTWTAAHLGPPRFEAAVEGARIEAGRLRIHVEAHDAYVLPALLRPPPGSAPELRGRGMRTPDAAIARAAAAYIEEAAALLPPARGRIVYIDTWIVELYAQNVGYRLELTEPVEDAMRAAAASLHIGHVLTRPFQWGNPVVAWY